MKHIFPALALLLFPAFLPAADHEPTLELADCRITAGPGYPGIKARCGIFLRPLDPDNPESGQLELNVAVVPALSLEPEPDPLVPIAGGPGGASTVFYAGYARAFRKIRRTRDILLLDQRGTGDSAPMDCEIDDDIVEGQFSIDDTIAETRKCLDSLPHDPRFFTTSVAVEDLEALRVALGYPSLNLYGSSYGTRVAQHFLRRYPDSTRTVILDGVAPPQIALGPGIAIEAQKALDSIFERCAQDSDCNTAFPSIREDFAELEASLGQESVEVTFSNPSGGRPETMSFGDAEFSGALRLMSYHPSSVALMPLMIDEAVNGNYQPLAARSQMIVESMTRALSLGMHNAVVCTEDAPFFDSEEVTREQLEATYIGPMQIEALDAICGVWPKGVLDDGLRQPLATDKPVLLLSGDADPVTPPYFAELASVEMSNSKHLIGHRQGHGLAVRGCMPDVIADFVESASIEDLDTACMDRLHAMPFFLDFSGPSP